MKPSKKNSSRATPAPSKKTSRPVAKKKSAPAKSKPSQATKSPRPPALRKEDVPAFLFEPDDLPVPPPLGVGQTPIPPRIAARFGTERLYLTAREPHWLYAHWDMTSGQLRNHNSESASGHLVLKIFRDTLNQDLEEEIHLHAESMFWFVPVRIAGGSYVAELGFYSADHAWNSICASLAVTTPVSGPAVPAAMVTLEVAPPEPLTRISEMVRHAVEENIPLVEVIHHLIRTVPETVLPEPIAQPVSCPEPKQAVQSPAQIVGNPPAYATYSPGTHFPWVVEGPKTSPAPSEASIPSSLDLVVTAQFNSQATGPFPPFDLQPLQPGTQDLSLPETGSGVVAGFSPTPGHRHFWMNINAELIVYGATQPGATLHAAGRLIPLRPDGTFSFRFSFPEGAHELRITATSPDGLETREAVLHFTRFTVTTGHVADHPTPENLQSPSLAGLG